MEGGRPITFIFCSFSYYYNDDSAHMFWDFLLKPQNRMHAVNDRDLGAFRFKYINSETVCHTIFVPEEYLEIETSVYATNSRVYVKTIMFINKN